MVAVFIEKLRLRRLHSASLSDSSKQVSSALVKTGPGEKAPEEAPEESKPPGDTLWQGECASA